MSTKRKHTHLNEADPDSPLKRAKGSASSTQRKATATQPRNDPLFGQRFAFPGLSDDERGHDELDSDNDAENGNGSEALAYLRSVRSEAQRLPPVMAAEVGDNDAQLEYASRQYDDGGFVDGVWVAASSSGRAHYRDRDCDLMEAVEPDAQEECYASLCRRFEHLRETLHQQVPLDVVTNLDVNGEGRPTYLPRRSKRARQQWSRLLETTDPTMVQIACMELESVLEALRLAAEKMAAVVEEGDPAAVRRLSTWIWGLLGRCREVGQLSSDE
ncbi:hypothetical protein KEM52_001878, partial [Ascosphaera acerosa]